MRYVASALAFGFIVVSGCTAVESYDSLTSRTCPAPQKACNDKCVASTLPEFGCSSLSCDPCAVANATAACTASDGKCGVGTCNDGFGDCNGDSADGCEADFATSPQACGACGTVCKVTNATAGCAAGKCTVATCTTGFGDCDKNPANGCETDVTTDANNCGTCGNACGACSAGKCVGVTAIVSSPASNFTCAVVGDGSVRCWGDASANQLGSGALCGAPPCQETVPKTVSGLKDAVSVAIGSDHGCAVRKDGSVACWGNNTNGQAGAGVPLPDTSPYAMPTQVKDLEGAAAVLASEGFSVALTKAGGLFAWGINGSGQLGVKNTDAQAKPLQVGGISSVASIGLGVRHACARTASGQLFCWGHNEGFALGVPQNKTFQVCGGLAGNTKCSYEPVEVTGISSVVTVAGGGDHTCVVRQPSAIACAGSNDKGQIGNGGAGGPGATVASFTPVFVPPGFGETVRIALGSKHSCALQKDGRVWCWGANNQGQLGNGSRTDANKPGLVLGPDGVALTGALDVAVGREHTCVLTAKARVVCFGKNDKGQLAVDPSKKDSSEVAVEVTALP